MLSPAFNIIASSLARCEASREMDLAEMAMGAPAHAHGGASSPQLLPSGVAGVLKRYGAAVRAPVVAAGGSVESSGTKRGGASSSSSSAAAAAVADFTRRESLRRAEEMPLIVDTLQAAAQTAMTLKLGPASSYLLSFSTTRDVADEALAASMNLSPEDLTAIADTFALGQAAGGVDAGGDVLNASGASASSSTSGSAFPHPLLASAFPRQFFDPTAPHNNVFSLLVNKRRVAAQQQAAAEQQQQSVERERTAAGGKPQAPPPTPAPLPTVLDTLTDILGRLLRDDGDAEEGSENDSDRESSMGLGRRQKKGSSVASTSSSSRSSSYSSFASSRHGGGQNSSDGERFDEDGDVAGAKKKKATNSGSRRRSSRRSRRSAAMAEADATGGGGGGSSGMRTLLEASRRKWAALFIVWGRWSTAMALGGGGSGGGGGGSGSSSAVNLSDILAKFLTAHVYPSFDAALQTMVLELEGGDCSGVHGGFAATFDGKQQQPVSAAAVNAAKVAAVMARRTPTPPPPNSSSAPPAASPRPAPAVPTASGTAAAPAPAYVARWAPLISSSNSRQKLSEADAATIASIVKAQSAARRYIARAVLFPRRFDELFGTGAFAAAAAKHTNNSALHSPDGRGATGAYLTAVCGRAPNSSSASSRLPSSSSPSSSSPSVLSRQRQAKYLREARHENTFAALLGAYGQQQGQLEAYVGAARQLMADEARAEAFYSTEEAAFNKQFKQWSAQMTRHYLEEVPLDVDWAVQKTPLPPSSAGGGDGGQKEEGGPSQKGVFTDPETGLRYQRTFLNLKTGRVQTENPNALKAAAAKSRQLAKAQREREQRLAEMAVFVAERVNGVKRDVLPALEDQLAAPVYL